LANQRVLFCDVGTTAVIPHSLKKLTEWSKTFHEFSKNSLVLMYSERTKQYNVWVLMLCLIIMSYEFRRLCRSFSSFSFCIDRHSLVNLGEIQQFASKHKPQTFSRVCLRLKRDVYRWKRNVSLLMWRVKVQWPNSVIFHVLICFRVRFSVSKLTIL
jgi:hypothetical protein